MNQYNDLNRFYDILAEYENKCLKINEKAMQIKAKIDNEKTLSITTNEKSLSSEKILSFFDEYSSTSNIKLNHFRCCINMQCFDTNTNYDTNHANNNNNEKSKDICSIFKKYIEQILDYKLDICNVSVDDRTLKLTCKTMHYLINIRLNNDCYRNCYVSGVLNLKDNTDIGMHGYFSDNEFMERFLITINNGNISQLIKTKYKHFIELHDLLKKKYAIGKAIISKPNYMKRFFMKFQIFYSGDYCTVVIDRIKESSAEYCVHLYPSDDILRLTVWKGQNNRYKKITRSIKDILDTCPNLYLYKYNYKSKDDLLELVQCIKSYFNHMNGNYGYYNHKTKLWQNNTQIENLVGEINDEAVALYLKKNNRSSEINISSDSYRSDIEAIKYYNVKLDYKSTINNYNSDIVFETMIIYHPRRMNIVYCLESDEYMTDIYAFKFGYIKSRKSNQCYFKIEGKYSDITKMKYSEKKIYDMDDIFYHEGSYDECFDILRSIFHKLFRL